MTTSHRVLPIVLLEPGTAYATPDDRSTLPVTLESPALDVMTDLRRVPPFTVEPNVQIDLALERMKHTGVRLLLVASKPHELLGIISATDIQGDRPLRFQQEVGVGRAEVLVRDIMTPCERLEAIPLADVQHASVGDVIETLKRLGRQHTLVVDRSSDPPCVCGIFSSTRIGRQLGVRLQTEGVAHTFAELEQALHG
ncbi:MAG TPA: CBS domain-containing protein [Gammaproteobacteria bacterium]|nr:CBS domain-containing protein [Gammaproteobacteria bacterium]